MLLPRQYYFTLIFPVFLSLSVMVVVPTLTPLIVILLLSTATVAKSVAAETAVKGEVPVYSDS